MLRFKKLLVFLVGFTFLLPVVPANADEACEVPGPNKNLTGCDFSGFNFDGYDLTNSILNQANLTNADLSGADLSGIRAEKIVGKPSNLPAGWITLNGFLLGPEANLSSLNLSNMNLTNVNLKSANLSFALLMNVNLNNVDLSDANLERVYGNGITGTPLALPTDWNLEKGFLIGPKANLTSLTISDIDFRSLNIKGATFQGTALIRANFSGMDMREVNLAMSGLVNANIDGANFADNDFEGLITRGVTGTPSALPEGWVLRSGFLFGMYANFSSADLSNMNLTGLDLSGINMNAANFSNANLAGVDLRTTSIVSANLSGANISGTNLTGVDLTGLVAQKVVGTPIGLNEDWTLFEGFLIGPTANLSTADLSGLDLRSLNLRNVNLLSANLSGTNLAWMNLEGANLSGVNLVGANVSGTSFSGANFSGVLARDLIGIPDDIPSPWKLRNGFFLGPKANLNGANLSGMNLSGLDLTDATLASANLSGADLRGTKLTRAVLHETNLTGANLLNVVSGEIVGTPTGLPSTFTFTDGAIKGIIFLSPTPTITGLAKVGSVLSVSTGTWDEGITLSYQWLRNGVAIPDATSNTYTPVVADFNKGISVTVTGTGTGGVNKSKNSIDKPIAAGTMAIKTPKITGAVAKGKTVKVTTTAWVPDAKITYSWLLDGKAIKGATKSSYKILPTQVGKKLSVLVKQTALGYTTASKASTAVKVK